MAKRPDAVWTLARGLLVLALGCSILACKENPEKVVGQMLAAAQQGRNTSDFWMDGIEGYSLGRVLAYEIETDVSVARVTGPRRTELEGELDALRDQLAAKESELASWQHSASEYEQTLRLLQESPREPIQVHLCPNEPESGLRQVQKRLRRVRAIVARTSEKLSYPPAKEMLSELESALDRVEDAAKKSERYYRDEQTFQGHQTGRWAAQNLLAAERNLAKVQQVENNAAEDATAQLKDATARVDVATMELQELQEQIATLETSVTRLEEQRPRAAYQIAAEVADDGVRPRSKILSVVTVQTDAGWRVAQIFEESNRLVAVAPVEPRRDRGPHWFVAVLEFLGSLFVLAIRHMAAFSIFWALVGVAIGLSAAQRRNLNMATAIIGGILLGPFAILMFLLSPTGKKCPFCQSLIDKKAIVCPRCQRDQPEEESKSA